MTLAPCPGSKARSERCLMKDGRKIGILHSVALNSKSNPSILQALESLDSRIQNGSWGAAHLMGYQDAIGKIKIGYRGDLLLIDHPTLSGAQSVSIQNVLIDGIPQEIGPASLGSSFWFWKTVSLGL